MRILIITTLIAVLISACEHETTYVPTVYQDVELQLNNDQKWIVPSEMMIYMDSSMLLIDHLENTSPEELTRLKNEFVSHCSMKGEGHDVLHAWLIPYMGILEDYNAASEDSEIDKVTVELKEAKRLFELYFE